MVVPTPNVFLSHIWVHLLLLIISGAVGQEYHIVQTAQSLIKFPLSSPNLEYFAIDQRGTISSQGFTVTFNSIYESTQNQQIISELELDKVNYTINYTPLSPNDGLHLINYTIGTQLGKLIFQIPENDLLVVNPLSLSNVSIKAGSVKFSMILAGWEFRSQDNSLFLSATISTTDNDGMNECWSSQSEHPYFPQYEKDQHYDILETTELVCNTRALKASLSLLGFANVVPFYPEYPPYILSTKTHASLTFRNGTTGSVHSVFEPQDTSVSGEEDKCQDTLDIGPNGEISALEIRLEFPSFFGSLAYDPQLSILFGGNSNKGGCESSSNSIIHDPIFWLSVSFFIVAVFISVTVAAGTRVGLVSKLIKGKEGSRIHKLRRRSKRPSEPFRDSECE